MKHSTFMYSVLAASLVLVSATASAHTKGYKGESDLKCEAPAPCCPTCPVSLMDGFYVGLGLGYDSYRVRNSFDVANNDEDDFLSGNPPVSATGWVPELFLGYGKYVTDTFYLGGEAFINTSNAEGSYSVSDTDFNYSSKIEGGTGFGIAFLPGIKLNCTTLAYLRLGYNWERLEAKQSFTDLDESTSGSVNTTNTVHGFSYGVGMESLISCNWSLRAEYTHTNYSTFNSGLETPIVATLQGSTDTLSSKYDPSDNQFMLSLIYHIG